MWINTLCKLNKQLTLNNLILPATHNSCAYKIDHSLIKHKLPSSLLNNCLVENYIERWTLNQNINLYEQLEMGVRLFNIDISYFADKFYTSHTFLLNELENDLKDIKKWTDLNKGELIVLSFVSHDIPNNKILEFENLIVKYFLNIIYPAQYAYPLQTPIYNFINQNNVVLIYYDKTTGLFYKSIKSSWENTNKIEKFTKKLKNTLETLQSNRNIFSDINFTLTPTYNDIIKSILCFKNYYNLEKFVKKFNTNFIELFDMLITKLKYVNAISMDYIDVITCNYIIQLNYKK